MSSDQVKVMSMIGYGRSSAMETYVRGQWYKVYITLEDDYLCISLDETYENCTSVNGLNNNTLGKILILLFSFISFHNYPVYLLL